MKALNLLKCGIHLHFVLLPVIFYRWVGGGRGVRKQLTCWPLQAAFSGFLTISKYIFPTLQLTITVATYCFFPSMIVLNQRELCLEEKRYYNKYKHLCKLIYVNWEWRFKQFLHFESFFKLWKLVCCHRSLSIWHSLKHLLTGLITKMAVIKMYCFYCISLTF